MSNDAYAKSARAYVGDGLSPLPLKAGTKRPRLSGYHGWEGKWVDAVVARKWSEKYGSSDVAIRLPKWIICFDVDDYEGKAGGKTLAALEAELGPLPATVRSTARWGQGESGIKWFRVPPKFQDAHWAGVAGPGIEIVSWNNRVAVVWPSMHRTGQQYRWYDEGEGIELEWPEWDIPELPVKWCERFTDDGARGSTVKVTDIRAWLRDHNYDEPCEQMVITRNLWIERLGKAKGAGGTHDMALKGVMAVLGDCAAGHTGVWNVLGDLMDNFLTAIAGRDRARRAASMTEWRAIVKGAVELVAGDIKSPHDECPAAEGLESLSGDDDPVRAKKDSALLAEMKNGTWLNAQTFAPMVFAIPELIPEGLSVIAGPPKAGKSVILLQFGLEAALGGEMFGMEVGKHRVLYLALEDSHRRMQTRCLELLDGESIPDWFDYILKVKPGQLIPTVRAYIKEYKQHHPLVMVDTLGKVLEGAKTNVKESDYDRDYRIVGDLKDQADDYPGSSVLASRHTRKGKAEDWIDMISGTTAISGAADTILALKRNRNSNDGILHVTGRDIEDNEYALTIERPRGWALDGEDMKDASTRVTTVRSANGRTLGDRSIALVEFVEDNPSGVTPQQIADEIGISKKDAQTYIYNSMTAGRITRISRGVYGPIGKQKVSKDDKEHGEDESPFG